MSHLPALPILVPLVAAALLLLCTHKNLAVQRGLSLVAALAVVVVAALLLSQVHDGTIHVYRLGNWPAPFGIVLVVDRLAAMMIAITALLAAATLLAATSGADSTGKYFHVFFQLQIAGIAGAFLTGDLFNLFVFFEILLLASYALLVHGGGTARARAGLAYVILNLLGSALFLIGLGLLYGTLGTLNIADLPIVMPTVPEADQGLVRTALALLMAVFALKAALLPLGFWLPHVYHAAMLPIAALFAIMTKIGIYAMLRVSSHGLSAAPFSSDLLQPWLAWLAIATIALGAFGALAARHLSTVVAHLVVISSGTLLLALVQSGARANAALLFYLVHTTVVTGALFLLADAIARRRGSMGDVIDKGPRIGNFMTLGAAFIVLGVAASGAPPLTGFLGKLMILQSLQGSGTPLAWSVILVSGFVVALAFARSASAIFWEPGRPSPRGVVPEVQHPGLSAGLLLLVIAALALFIYAAPIASYARAASEQLEQRQAYVSAVIGRPADIKRQKRP